jgi:hypothetical protein
MGQFAEEAPHDQLEADTATRPREIRHLPDVAAVNPLREGAA